MIDVYCSHMIMIYLKYECSLITYFTVMNVLKLIWTCNIVGTKVEVDKN